LVFETNSRFVFHDSRGIESGTTNDIETIQAFISKWAHGRSLNDRLHAIWYCISVDNKRLFTAAEEQFFDKINPSGVPVILVFTKFESLEAEVFAQLQMNSQYSGEEAIQQAQQVAQKTFEDKHLIHFTSGRKYPPKKVVFLKSITYMDKENAQCSYLIEATLNALNSYTINLLLLEVQQINLGWRLINALHR
ncbi:hypothetical protein HYPSUDRAFT_144590, partial [Hypholoma sublateritium FD-334 SS-4]